MCAKAKARRYDRKYFESVFRRGERDSQRSRNRLYLIRRYRAEGKLLEIGCGKGYFLQAAARYFTVEGIDISPYAVQALAGLPQLHIRRGDIEIVSLPAAEYHVIAAFNVLEHLSHPQTVLEKVHTALREDGIFVGSVPYNGALVGRVHTAITNLVDRTHVSTYTAPRWRCHFKAAGFGDLRFFGEVMLGKKRSFYIQNRLWPCFSLNLIFVMRK